MKKGKDSKPIITIPDGAYESGMIHHEMQEGKTTRLNDITTDAQGNGYPAGDYPTDNHLADHDAPRDHAAGRHKADSP